LEGEYNILLRLHGRAQEGEESKLQSVNVFPPWRREHSLVSNGEDIENEPRDNSEKHHQFRQGISRRIESRNSRPAFRWRNEMQNGTPSSRRMISLLHAETALLVLIGASEQILEDEKKSSTSI
jgi:hypothetical protein